MGRPLRIDYKNAIHHVMTRGNNGKTIFNSNDEKRKYLYFLKKYKESYNISLLAYCVMDNHIHLLVESDEPNLSSMMREIQTNYAKWYNHKHSRYGRVFSGRYRSCLCETRGYYINLICYIHLNPQKAGINDALLYPYSSISEYYGVSGYCNMEKAYHHLGNNPQEAINNLNYYLSTNSEALMLKEIEHIKKLATNSTVKFYDFIKEMDYDIDALKGNKLMESFNELRTLIIRLTHKHFRCSNKFYQSVFDISYKKIRKILTSN